MQELTEKLCEGDQASIREALEGFNVKNIGNYKLGESPEVRKEFCSALLAKFYVGEWSPETNFVALKALRIFTREHEGSSQLKSLYGLTPLVRLAKFNAEHSDIREFFYGGNTPQEQIDVVIEAVKCLCNLVLNNHSLADVVSELGCLTGLRQRLLDASTALLPYDVMFFDLRLLFLITACGPDQRQKFRDELKGPIVLLKLLETFLYGVPSKRVLPKAIPVKAKPDDLSQADKSSSNKPTLDTAPPHSHLAACKEDSAGNSSNDTPTSSEESVEKAAQGEIVKSKESICLTPPHPNTFILPEGVTEKTCMLVSETLKIMFSQTVNWTDDEDCEDEEMDLFVQLSRHLQVLICSIPLFESKAITLTLNHCCEVLMNIPHRCHHIFLLPCEISITPILQKLYPSLFVDKEAAPGEEAPQTLLSRDFDQNYLGHNMAVAVCMLNYLDSKLLPRADQIDSHGLSIVLGAMTLLSKGNRVIRRYLKGLILPPLVEVKERPESEKSIKGRLVRLMTAGPHDCMDMVAEFLFVLCKESASRLVKHTGYGNAAGLLMSHGLLGGGRSEGQADYSSDSGNSEEEEYRSSRGCIDPVTGGPPNKLQDSLDQMTPEEQAEEEAKLHDLFARLQQRGITMMPLDKDNKPIHFEEPKDEEEEDKDKQG